MPDREEIWTIAPPPCASIHGTTCQLARTLAMMSTAKLVAHPASSSLVPIAEGLLISTSIRPRLLLALSKNLLSATPSETSQTCAYTLTPCASNAEQVCSK